MTLLAYDRPDITKEEQDRLAKLIFLIHLRAKDAQLAIISAVIIENVRLTKEVNEHRAARGIELLPIYEPNI